MTPSSSCWLRGSAPILKGVIQLDKTTVTGSRCEQLQQLACVPFEGHLWCTILCPAIALRLSVARSGFREIAVSTLSLEFFRMHLVLAHTLSSQELQKMRYNA